MGDVESDLFLQFLWKAKLYVLENQELKVNNTKYTKCAIFHIPTHKSSAVYFKQIGFVVL